MSIRTDTSTVPLPITTPACPAPAIRTSERRSVSAQFKVLCIIASYSARVMVWPRIDSEIVEARLASLIVGLIDISGILVTNRPPSDEVQVLANKYIIIT